MEDDAFFLRVAYLLLAAVASSRMRR